MSDPASDVHITNTPALSRLLIVIGLTFVVLMLSSGPQMLDPMLRHDDFPALFAQAGIYYNKTLHEGRWLNYLWHLRGFVTPTWVNFAVYQFFWAAFAGAAALNACGRKKQLSYVIVLALLIAIAPQALLISLWFNTLVPGLAFVALFAVLATWFDPKKMRLLLLVFVPITLMGYTTYPMLLLAVCLTTRGISRSWRDLVAVLGLFIVSFAIGMLLIYTLNYIYHGVFGIPMAPWRHPTPAHDLVSAITNLSVIAEFFKETALTIAFNVVPLIYIHALILVTGLIILARKTPWLALYIFTGMVVGLGLLSLQAVLSGITVPPRATAFAWMLYSVLCVRIALLGRDRGGRAFNLSWALLIFLTIIYLMFGTKHYFLLSRWQAETRKMANEAGKGLNPIYVTGSYKALASAKAAGIQGPLGLSGRLTYLTGRTVIICSKTPDACKGLTPEVLAGASGTIPEIKQSQDKTIILLPPLTD